MLLRIVYDEMEPMWWFLMTGFIEQSHSGSLNRETGIHDVSLFSILTRHPFIFIFGSNFGGAIYIQPLKVVQMGGGGGIKGEFFRWGCSKRNFG